MKTKVVIESAWHSTFDEAVYLNQPSFASPLYSLTITHWLIYCFNRPAPHPTNIHLYFNRFNRQDLNIVLKAKVIKCSWMRRERRRGQGKVGKWCRNQKTLIFHWKFTFIESFPLFIIQTAIFRSLRFIEICCEKINAFVIQSGTLLLNNFSHHFALIIH